MDKIFNYDFAKIYKCLLDKVEKKGRTKQELDKVICWLTGYSQQALQKQLANSINYKTFFDQAPQINPDSSKIKGKICGYDVQQITDPTMQKMRFLDKLVDELAQGKPIEKVVRN